MDGEPRLAKSKEGGKVVSNPEKELVAIELKALFVHYMKINRTCAYQGKDGGCRGDVDFFSVTLTNTSEVMVRTMCEYHMGKEKKHFIEVNGLKMDGRTSIAGCLSDAVLVDESAIQESIDRSAKILKERQGQ